MCKVYWGKGLPQRFSLIRRIAISGSRYQCHLSLPSYTNDAVEEERGSQQTARGFLL